MSLNKQIRTCSPVMDLDTPSVWKLFSATDWNVSETYNKMYDSGIPIELQRTGSLLNYCAVRSVGTIKTLEPEMYAKINSRFNNVDFIASFSKSGYYNIAKPKDTSWSGSQHIKAGMSDKKVTEITDKYEFFMNKFGLLSENDFKGLSDSQKDNYFLSNNGIYGTRDGNIFKFSRSLELTKKLGSALKPIEPFQFIENILGEINESSNIINPRSRENIDKALSDFFGLTESEIKEFHMLKTIHTTWEEYCLYLLNTSDNPARDIWREKLVTSILSWKFSEGSVEPCTIDALNVLSEIDPVIVSEVEDDYWSKSDYHIGGVLPISGKTCLSLSHYPQQSLEKEAYNCVMYIIENNLWENIDNSPSLRKLLSKMETIDSKTMLTATQLLMVMYGNDSVKKKNKVDENTEQKYENIITYEDIREKLMEVLRLCKELEASGVDTRNNSDINAIMQDADIQTWLNRINNGLSKWWKENIHSTSSWKRFTINILKGDISCKYLGFGPTCRERLIRADAMQAFSQKQEEKEKAKKEAERLAKKIAAENKM